MHTDRRPVALFVFAHQDDEVGAMPWIELELGNGADVACVYLTDGASRTRAEIRDAESRAVLTSVGVPAENIGFLSDERGRIADGSLAEEIARGDALLSAWIAARAAVPATLYTLAWEGGHADHDAAHLLALVQAQRRGIVANAWQFTIYNGYGCPRPFFRVLRPLPPSRLTRECRYSFRKAVRYAFSCWRYPSQRRTWSGLFPELALRRLWFRRERVDQLDPRRIHTKPHEGELLYERLFGVAYARFAETTSAVASEIARLANS